MSAVKGMDFEEIVANYGALISKICYYFSIDSEEFKDLRQEVLINIWKGLDSFNNASKLSTWVYRVSFNTCISFQRKNRKLKETVPLESILDLSADDDTSKLEKYKAMHRMISKLNFEDRVLILLWLDEKSYEEIAELMDLKRNTVAVRLKRAKEKLTAMKEKIFIID